MPAPDMLNLAGLLNAFILLVLGLMVTYWWKTYDARQTKDKDAATDLHQWRESRLAAEKANAEAIKKEHADRIFWQLENAADWERLVKILTEFGEVQRQLAVVASTSHHHDAEIQRINAQITEMNKHLNDFIMRHVRPASA